MRERGDMQCLHEPFMYDYYINNQHRTMPFFEPQENHPVSYADVRNMIIDKAQKAPVFFKDMSYYVTSEIASDTEFSQQLTHCFLIRNPKASIASYYKLDKELTLEEVGIEAQWRHYSHLLESGCSPVIIQAESIRKNSQIAVNDWWEKINLEAADEAFQWSSKHPKDWSQVRTWHESSINSRSIHPWSDNEETLEQHRFDAAVKEAPHLLSYYNHHVTYYEMLKQNSC